MHEPEDGAVVITRFRPRLHAGRASDRQPALKRWILGTHQGSVIPDHLQSYLEEFTFRSNHCISLIRGLVFRRLLE